MWKVRCLKADDDEDILSAKDCRSLVVDLAVCPEDRGFKVVPLLLSFCVSVVFRGLSASYALEPNMFRTEQKAVDVITDFAG